MNPSTINIKSKIGEKHYLVPISDAHLDSTASDRDAFKKITKEYSKLPNCHFITIGDMGSWIFPQDSKRHAPGVNRIERAAYLNYAVKDVAEQMGHVDWDFLSLGNHETSAMLNQGVCPGEMLCDALGVRNGGYSGYITYRMNFGQHRTLPIRFLYHHGAWCGAASKGLPAFSRWTSDYEGWDVALAGHNHNLMADVGSIVSPTKGDRLASRKIHRVFCGTYQKGYDTTDGSGYEERKGLGQKAIGSPLITWWARSTTTAERRETGQTLALEIRVTT